jgi:hypothetical protein
VSALSEKRMLLNPCPKCRASSGEQCRRSNGRHLHISQSHAARIGPPENFTPKKLAYARKRALRQRPPNLAAACELAARTTGNPALKEHLLMAAEKLR